MRIVLVGGPPAVGKTAAARRLLAMAAEGTELVQWIDADALWRHQPWRVDDRTRAMVEANLASVIANADAAGVDLLIVTRVFHRASTHDLVRSLRSSPTSSPADPAP